MLVRRVLQGTVITIGGGEIKVTVMAGKGVKLGIEAPADMMVDAHEVDPERPPPFRKLGREIRQTRKQAGSSPIDNAAELGQG